MITLNQLSTEVIRTMSGGDQSIESKIQRREVIVRIRQVLNEMLKVELLNHRSEGTRLPVSQYIGTYPGLVVQEVGDQKHLELPETFLGLPYNKGIYALYPDNRPKSQIIRRNNPYVSNGLASKYLEGSEGYWTEGFKVYFDDPEFSHKKVTAKLVIAAPDTIGKDDPLPITPEMQSQAIRAVTQDMMLQKAIPEDQINDSDDIEIATKS